jgi:hypothetical protein
MRRGLLELCLLAYPRARRKRDHDYLRDLALDLAEEQGVLRQVLSLLRGGLRQRIEDRRRRGSASLGRWVKRTVVASFVPAALVLAGTAVIGSPDADRAFGREVEAVACVSRDEPRATPGDRLGGCSGTKRLVAARVRAGWDCTTHRHAKDGRSEIASRCTRGSAQVAQLSP